jgi:hypothetical protein
MQIERNVIVAGISKKVFDLPEEFNLRKAEIALEEDDVEEVHVFKSTPSNLKMANLRSLYPNKTRRQLRKLMGVK